MVIEFYDNYSVNYSKLLIKNNEDKVMACLYINRSNGAIECDSWYITDEGN